MMGAAAEYWIDAVQRGVLFLDVMRARGNNYLEHAAQAAPHVLNYDVELIADARKFPRPVNYCLAKVVAPKGVEIDPIKRPFVVVDPRAGHGPGIGGFKADSEIGVALKAGHPCYFVGFLPDPVTGQTIEDIARAEAKFLETVIDLHPQAEGKPCVIGNCQAGWAIMMLAAMRPELFGPLIIAGSPLSYWAGVRGQNPMRYSGGLLGGSWLTALMSDLGGGKFDGAWLVQNFENLNPSNTYWSKQYNLYAKVDTEADRYLEFERWWGGHVLLNAEEIQFIVDELFVGNNLAAGRIKSSDGRTVDLRNIRSPIVVFCSKGDNITPPQQALGWILDLYESVDEIRSYGQTIVYSVHETAGHLGIFVSGGVARKEHSEFSSNIDLIDVLPPGLYEAVFEARSGADVHRPDLASGDWIMRCEARTLDDIRALGGNDSEDERRFATMARVSEANLALYRTFAQPFVHFQRMHPLRMQYEMFSDVNPLMKWIGDTASQVRENRRAAQHDNPLMQAQDNASKRIVEALDAWRDATEKASEAAFLSIYGSPVLQAAVGIDPKSAESMRKAGKSALHLQLIEARIAELKARIPQGGMREAMIRALLYIGMSRGSFDERGFEAIRRIRQAQQELPNLSIEQFKLAVREQYFMLLIDPIAAIEAIPLMLPPARDTRTRACDLIQEILESSGGLPPEGEERLRQIKGLFGRPADQTPAPVIEIGRSKSSAEPGAARTNATQSEGRTP
jgi:pimeloyl-ACP methyl ester carboxylesterase